MFRLYRFSPINSKAELIKAVEYIHFACHKLAKQSLGHYLPTAGNVGLFCHYDDEFKLVKEIRNSITEKSTDKDLKYYTLLEPIEIKAKDDIPKTRYTHLYIRKPDIYRAQVGDIDFIVKKADYELLKQSVLKGNEIKAARLFDRSDLDMIELFDPDIDALAYVSTSTIAEKVRIKLSSVTKL